MAVKNLTASELLFVKKHLGTRTYPSNSPVFAQGQPASGLFIIVTGRVRLVHYSFAGREFTPGIWTKGYVIGLISSYLGEMRFISAITLEPTTVETLSRKNLLALMRAIPDFALNITTIIARQASDSIRRSGPLALDDAKARLCRALLRIAEPAAPPASTNRLAFVSGISQQELASMTGVSRVWVNHALAELEHQGLIKRQKRQIVILDIPHLIEKIAI